MALEHVFQAIVYYQALSSTNGEKLQSSKAIQAVST